MKLLRRLSGNTFTPVLGIVLSCALFNGCKTTTREPEAVFTDVKPTPVLTVPETVGTGATGGADGTSIISRQSYFHVGDSITVTFSGVPDAPQDQETEVLADGTIILPLVGSVKAEGRTLPDLQKDIQERYNKYYKPSSGFTVTVKPQARIYYIGGEIRNPGPKMYLYEVTVTKAIQTAGDFTDFANKRNVQLVRADGTKLTINCKKALTRPELDPPVFPGDKIIVRRRLF
jgi:protein involved in polysaccharide export with SLBB domain